MLALGIDVAGRAAHHGALSPVLRHGARPDLGNDPDCHTAYKVSGGRDRQGWAR